MKLFSILFILAQSVFFLGCESSYQFNDAATSRIISTLSSDEMKGRKALSPEIAMASSFIETEFRKAGLTPAGDDNTFLQTFSLYTIKVADINATVDNKVVGKENFFVIPDREESLLSEENAETVVISKDDNFRMLFSEIRNSEVDQLVLIHPDHESSFRRYQSFYNRESRRTKLGERGAKVFLLHQEIPNTFSIQIQNTVKEHRLSNILAKVEGKRSDEIVVFSAHFDHIGVISAVEGDSIGNGANDNASGVAAVIELAKYFNNEAKPERTILFVAFNAEELGLHGSKFFSENINPDHIVSMINIEMIGKPALNRPNSAWVTGYNYSELGKLLQEGVEGKIDFEFYADPYSRQNLFSRSDNISLAKLGIPAHTISTTAIDVDKDYHTVADEFLTINVSHTTHSINAIALASQEIISGEATPSRIDVTQINR